MSYEQAVGAPTSHRHDYVSAYVDDLAAVIDLDVIREAGLRLGVDLLGGASLAFWTAIAERHRLDLTIVNDAVDPTFRFVPVDWDGKIRMDCSPYAMSRPTELRDQFDIAFGNDPDADRHGIVTRSEGLLNPNHHIAACVAYLFGDRDWSPSVGVGKTVVTSSIVDRVAEDLGRRVDEVPVGFKWFADGLLAGELGLAGEESAGASFLRRDATAWSTDKDGLIACLAAAEMTARRGTDPGQLYQGLAERLGAPEYLRVDVTATPEEKAALAALAPTTWPPPSWPASRSATCSAPPWQRRADRRREGGRRERLVRGPAVGHGGRLQDLRRELPRPRAPRAHPRRGAEHRPPRADALKGLVSSAASGTSRRSACAWPGPSSMLFQRGVLLKLYHRNCLAPIAHAFA